MSTEARPQLVVENMPSQYLADFNKSRTYIANITDTPYMLSRTYGNFIIPANKQGEPFSLTTIGPAKGVMDMGDKHKAEFPIHPLEIANDLCREINIGAGGDAGTESFLGVFVCGQAEPTPKELADAHARLERFYRWCVAEGDKIWQQTRLVIMIPDVLKRAAVYLKLDEDREWVSNTQTKMACPGCGDRLRVGVAMCKSCGAILDRDKAVALGMIPPPAPQAEGEEAPDGDFRTTRSRRTPKVS